MPNDLDQLVSDVIAATDAAPPDLLAEDSPALSLAGDESIYLVGLIGGKDVGKSSLVNALVGLPISAASAAGPGTENVIAYAHRSAETQVAAMLARYVPGKHSIVLHDNAALSRQVLLDLPDIDSVYADHIETTRRMLRHMLYPIWLQSIEKYADQQPQRLLARVAEGNDPRNFLFAINKIDLLIDREGDAAAAELCADFAARIARTLSLAGAPQVFALSAARPQKYDLPALRQKLSQERSREEVARSSRLAGLQRGRTLLGWLDRQQLAERAGQASRSLEEAQELIAERITAPLLETALRRMFDDPAYRAQLVEPAVSKRLARWPIVGAINSVLSPVLSFAQRSLSSVPIGARADQLDVAIDDSPLTQRITAAFAHLNRIDPASAGRLGERKLWDEPVARGAAADLRARLAAVTHRQRQAILERAGGRSGVIAPVFRILLTVGAILWFPIVQPILHAFLSAVTISGWGDFARLVVEVLSATFLLRAGAFLLIWFAVLWMMVRWFAQRRAEAVLRGWSSGDDPQLSAAAQVIEWSDDLLSPLAQHQQALAGLWQREQEIRSQLAQQREAA